MKQLKQSPEQEEGNDQLYFTSDSLAFFDEQKARSHAKRLKDKTISTKTREEVNKEAEELVIGPDDDTIDEI